MKQKTKTQQKKIGAVLRAVFKPKTSVRIVQTESESDEDCSLVMTFEGDQDKYLVEITKV